MVTSTPRGMSSTALKHSTPPSSWATILCQSNFLPWIIQEYFKSFVHAVKNLLNTKTHLVVIGIWYTRVVGPAIGKYKTVR